MKCTYFATAPGRTCSPTDAGAANAVNSVILQSTYALDDIS